MANPVALPAPRIGDVVWCWFPHDLVRPAKPPKPRPAIVLRVREPAGAGAAYQVDVCQGTSQIGKLFPSEFLVAKQEHPDEYDSMGLSYDTKFDLGRIATLDYTSDWFTTPPKPRFGRNPKLGSLHVATLPRVKEALRKVKK
ncbi:type II toxin-antitoxin system PemK/MazF family toxin [Solimonas sp. SE-A11]|uniref:type II toxin-antitoxin system PemK/MazF family toxin n=1 Tax=Solimonas sp. SE-A11 TaxID=3054954 RepID=UPI00259C8CC7|nr:type II toxin-antitoxin system PemK/MazF family toxin [Solimonas sp. SE-A11]MDM4770913.1 type II toxin-antitoxin system PemK/MazF family toxin [Solimonas sp. SE-A11]